LKIKINPRGVGRCSKPHGQDARKQIIGAIGAEIIIIGKEKSMRILSSAMHAQLDYVFIIIFVALAKFLGWGSTLSWLLVGLACGVWIYSMLTHYELGLVGLIPLRVHLVIDVLSGLFLIAAPFLWLDQESGMRIWMVGVGLFELAIALMTEIETQRHEQTVENKL